jgi:filamentous hemagglutinin family protein
MRSSVSSVALNRVKGYKRSLIDGVLNANGQVFLVNTNGILFGVDFVFPQIANKNGQSK